MKITIWVVRKYGLGKSDKAVYLYETRAEANIAFNETKKVSHDQLTMEKVQLSSPTWRGIVASAAAMWSDQAITNSPITSIRQVIRKQRYYAEREYADEQTSGISKTGNR